MKVTLNRQLLGLEDLLLGAGQVTQIRGGEEVTITKISTETLLASGFSWLTETLPPGSDVEVVLGSDTITFKIPQGAIGANGTNGLTPNYEFTYNEVTGDLEYNLLGYTSNSEPSIQEC